MTHAAYPAARLRRTRMTAWSRDLHRETSLSPANLIWPLFPTEGHDEEVPVGTMPGVSRLSVDRLAKAAKEAAKVEKEAVKEVEKEAVKEDAVEGVVTKVVKKIKYNGETYMLEKSSGIVYNTSGEEVGKWNQEKSEVEFSEGSDTESDDEDEEQEQEEYEE